MKRAGRDLRWCGQPTILQHGALGVLRPVWRHGRETTSELSDLLTARLSRDKALRSLPLQNPVCYC